MFLSIHVIQSLPPSNPNRGRNGEVKTFLNGQNDIRARVSSQAWKRATRLWYQECSGLDRAQFASRSRLWASALEVHCGWAPTHQRNAIARILLALFNAGPENVFEVAANQGNLLFLGESEVKKLGLLAEHHSAILCDLADRFEAYKVYMANETPAEEQPAEIDPDDETPAGKKRKKTAKKAAFSHHPTSAELKKIKESISKELSSTVPGDVALFGRMMASLIETNVDGAVQVASAVSVNPIGRTKGVDGWYNGEVDFFAAVDDRKCGDDAGAGMIGETNFATPTYYRYANIAVADVVESVGDKVVAMAAIKAFVEGFVKSCPSGYSHQFAHHTLPEMVLLEAYDHPPISLWSAFTAPIENIDKSIVTDRSGLSVSQQAAERLMSQRQELYEMYGYAVAAEAVTALRDHYPDGVTLDKAIDSVLAAVV